MRVLGASGVQQSAAQRANAGAARRHESAAADGIQVDEDHGPPKRARLGDDGLTPAQLQDEIAPSLERWSEAVRSSADLMDGDICSKVLAELERLQGEVRASTFTGDAATLRAIAECPFPRAFLDIVKEIDEFEGKPLLECVAAGVSIEQRIAQGRLPSDDGGLGQAMMPSFAEKKAEEVERFKLRVERQHSEHEQMRKREQLAANRRVPALEAAEKSLREMRAEEGRIRLELAKVHAEAAQQRALLEKMLPDGDSRGKGADSNGSGLKDRSLAAVRKSAYDGPEVKAASDELLHARGNADRALENTEAAGQHLNFVCHVAEFLREARIAMTAQCDEILHDALQRELILLQRDRQVCQSLMELKKECGTNDKEEANRVSLESKYRKFYIEQLKSVSSRHLRSRFAAMSLIASAKDGAEAGNAAVHDMAIKVVQAVNEQRSEFDAETVQSELPEDIPPNKKASMLVLWPAEQKGADDQSPACPVCAGDIAALQELQQDTRVQGRIVARACVKAADEHICKLANASHTLPTVPAHLIRIPLGCLTSAIGEVCTGKMRSAFCLMPTPRSMAAVGGIRKSSAASVTISLLSVALMHARTEYFWLRKIAVIDCSDSSGDAAVAGNSILADDPDLLALSPLAISAGSSGNEAAASEPEDRNALFTEAAQKVASFQPQVIIYYLGESLGSKEPALQAGAIDSAWTGRWAESLAAKHCRGRALTVCSNVQLLTDFLVGMQSPASE